MDDPAVYAVVPDPAAIVAGDHAFVVRRLGGRHDDGGLIRCALTVNDDGSWSCGIQPVTGDGRPAGAALVVTGDALDPAMTALAVIAGAAPLPDRPIGSQEN